MINNQPVHNTNAFKRLSKLVPIFFIAGIFLSACTTKPSLEQLAIINLNQNLAQLTHWKLSGKIAWISPTERKSAYINWQQQGQAFTFSISNVLGISGGTMSYDGDTAILKADGEQYSDPSPAQLIYNLTGWDLPLSALQYWMKGASNESGRVLSNQSFSVVSSVTRYENGLIKQLISKCNEEQTSCSPWQIDYQVYKDCIINGVSYQLPSAITLTNLTSTAKVKIKVSKWSD